jgi:hypothetical protein
MARRAGLYDALDKALERHAFSNEEEAEAFALRHEAAITESKGKDKSSNTQTDNSLPLVSKLIYN